ncbi:hypothetical protein GCM10010156_66100 [Planobispora rosea]|uniref:Uncharacterized protein n=1 Tax=Planobispora rosea TaxID=35762 RepID=A0A8J3S6Z7_PLARO|nr:hypothetical protein [Planobispora rosea]GGS98755.1 hypothetical protein GCM10010156_66100 [Planobispora rosea]GIH87974.1 hypothetical protein Pro02_63820 [Planobispora rosea]
MSSGDHDRLGCAVWLVLAGDLVLIPGFIALLRHLLGPGPLSAITIIAVTLGLLAAGPLLVGRLDRR